MIFSLGRPDGTATGKDVTDEIADRASDIVASIQACSKEDLTTLAERDPRMAKEMRRLQRDSIDMRILQASDGTLALELL